MMNDPYQRGAVSDVSDDENMPVDDCTINEASLYIENGGEQETTRLAKAASPGPVVDSNDMDALVSSRDSGHTVETPVAFLGDVEAQSVAGSVASSVQVAVVGSVAEPRKQRKEDKMFDDLEGQPPLTPMKKPNNSGSHTTPPTTKGTSFQDSPTGTDPETPPKNEPIVRGTEADSPKSRCLCRRWQVLAIFLILVAVAIVLPLAVFRVPFTDSRSSNADINDSPTSVPTSAPVEPEAQVPPIVAPTTVAPTASPTGMPSATTSAPTAPTSSPTGGPSFTPTTATPTAAPTLGPTARPSSTPTLLPTAAPTPAPVTSSPTVEGGGLLTLLRTVTPLELLRDPTTPQGRAAQWLQNEDVYRQQVSLPDEQIIQRYAITVLDTALHSGVPTLSNPFVEECVWQGITCAQVGDSASSKIVKIVWANRGLSGEIPSEIKVLAETTYLDLGENAITGGLPDALFDLSGMEELYLHQNQLSGPLSERFADLPLLRKLLLSDNQFSGPFPTGLASPRSGSNNARPLGK